MVDVGNLLRNITDSMTIMTFGTQRLRIRGGTVTVPQDCQTNGNAREKPAEG